MFRFFKWPSHTVWPVHASFTAHKAPFGVHHLILSTPQEPCSGEEKDEHWSQEESPLWLFFRKVINCWLVQKEGGTRDSPTLKELCVYMSNIGAKQAKGTIHYIYILRPGISTADKPMVEVLFRAKGIGEEWDWVAEWDQGVEDRKDRWGMARGGMRQTQDTTDCSCGKKEASF